MLIWIGIAFSISQSAMFSGLNLALFGVSWLRLEVLATTGNDDARHLLALRKDSNFLLTTILWGNVAANVLLTILSDSIFTGAMAFVFSTFIITLGGEILPQAYFSRHALAVAGKLWPVLRFYQFLLYPLAKPTAKMLDAWLGQGGIEYFRRDSRNKSPLTGRDNVGGRARPVNMRSHASARRSSVRSGVRNARMGRTHA